MAVHRLKVTCKPKQATAMLAAPVVDPALPVPLVIQDDLETPVLLVLLVSLAAPSRLLVKSSPSRHADLAQLVHPAHPDLPDHPEMPDQTDNPATPDNKPDLENPDRRDPPAHLASPVNPEALDNPVNLDKASQPPLEHLDQQEMPDHKDQLDNPDNPETMDNPEAPAPRAHLDPTDSPAATDTPDNPVRLVNPVVKARRVSVPSTAPSMVVSSSRMELVVKRHDDRFIDLFYNFHHHHRHRFAIIAAFFFFCIVVSSFVLPSNFLCLFHCLLFESLGRCVVIVCNQLCLNLTTSSSFLEHHPFDPHIQINRKNGSDSSQWRIESVFFTFCRFVA